MGEKYKKGIGERIANNFLVVVVGLIASIVGIFSFVTDNQIAREYINSLIKPDYIENPLAETTTDEMTIWQVSFYNNKELQEPVAFEGYINGARNGLNVDWGTRSPIRKVNNDFFSGVFITTKYFAAGNYCFTIEVDDGAKLFIDGAEIRNVWWGYTPKAVYKTPYTLTEGNHLIQFYFFDEFENASFHVSWYANPSTECVTTGHPGVP